MADQKTTVAHTPGPWRVESGTTLVWGNCNPDDHSSYGMGYPVAECRINPSGNWSTGPYADEGEANAHLMAAAPEMATAARNALEVFLTVRMYFGDGSLGRAEIDDSIGQIKAALAKAGGGA